jgi:hypothetical protein
MREDYYFDENIEEIEEKQEDFYNEEEIERELDEGMISPEEEAFTRGFLNALEL